MNDASSIRPISLLDLDNLVAMVAEFESYLNSLRVGRENTPALTRDKFLKDAFTEHPAFYGLLAEQNAQPQGYLLYHYGYVTDVASRTVQVIDLFVKAGARGSGVGKALMQAVIPIAQKAGANLICTSVWKLNKDAQSFYKRLGAELIEEETIVWWSIK